MKRLIIAAATAAMLCGCASTANRAPSPTTDRASQPVATPNAWWVDDEPDPWFGDPVAPSASNVEGATAASRNRISLVAGLQSIADDDLDGTDLGRSALYGIEAVTSKAGRSLDLEAGLLYSGADDAIPGQSMSLDLLTAYLGVRKTWTVARRTDVYFGGGAEMATARLEAAGGFNESETDLGFGGYVHVGADYEIGRGVYVGVDGRLGGIGQEFDFGGPEKLDGLRSSLALKVGVGF